VSEMPQGLNERVPLNIERRPGRALTEDSEPTKGLGCLERGDCQPDQSYSQSKGIGRRQSGRSEQGEHHDQGGCEERDVRNLRRNRRSPYADYVMEYDLFDNVPLPLFVDELHLQQLSDVILSHRRRAQPETTLNVMDSQRHSRLEHETVDLERSSLQRVFVVVVPLICLIGQERVLKGSG